MNLSLWSLLCCFWILNASSEAKMKTIIDSWGRPVQLSKFKKLQIDFDLHVDKLGSDFTRIPILSLMGSRVRLVFYLNGWGEFGIMHHSDELDVHFESQQLFGCNLGFVRARAGISNQTFQHFRVVVPNERNVDFQYLLVDIDRYSTDREIDRLICPHDQTMSVWWGKADSDEYEIIRNLSIKVKDLCLWYKDTRI